MAEIIKRGKDKQGKERFLVKVFWGRDGKGKRIFHRKTISGKKEADAYARAKEHERDTGKPPKPVGLTVNDLLDRWLQHCKRTVRESTLEWYTYLMKRYVRPHLGDEKLTALKLFSFEDLYLKLEQQGLSGRSIKLIHARLVTAFEQAVKWELLSSNPVAQATTPKAVKREMDFFSPEEAQAFIAASRTDARGVLLRFAVLTGLRPEEYCGLKWDDLELDGSKRGVVYVRRSLKWLQGGRWKFDEPKTEKSKRVVYFPLSLARELQEYKRQQLEERLRIGKHYQAQDFVFASEVGAPLRRNLITYNHFRPTLQRAGLRQIRLYDLRHTWVTLSLLSGVSPKTVSEQAGHSSVNFTLDHYAHVLSSEREGASDRLETLLFSGVGTL